MKKCAPPDHRTVRLEDLGCADAVKRVLVEPHCVGIRIDGVDVMQFYLPSDGSTTVDGKVVVNIGPAIERAWAWTQENRKRKEAE